MPSASIANTEDFATTEYDAARQQRAADEPGVVTADGGSSTPPPTVGDDPDVGLSQKGTDEDAVIRRETEI